MGPVLTLAVVAALVSAVGFAVSTSLQHHAASALPSPGHSVGLLLQLARQPLWLLGAGVSATAFGLHAVAVHSGALVVVQPIVVSGIVFAVPVREALDRRRPSRRDVGWVSVTALGLVLFIVVAGPGGPVGQPCLHSAAWVVTGAVTVVAATVGAGRRARTATGQGLLLSAAAGVAFGLAAGLLKMTVLTLTQPPDRLLGYWPAVALVVVGTGGFVLNQRSYQLAPLSVTMPTLNVVDVLVAVVFGWYVFDEQPAHDPGSLVVEVLAVALMCVGVHQLVGRRPATAAPCPQRPCEAAARPH